MEKNFEVVWQNCLTVIRDNVSLQSFKTWFEPIKPIKLNKNVLTIQVPSQFFYEYAPQRSTVAYAQQYGAKNAYVNNTSRNWRQPWQI